jgi:hypothetical protein
MLCSEVVEDSELLSEYLVLMRRSGQELAMRAAGGNTCVTISKLGQKVTLQEIEPGSLL